MNGDGTADLIIGASGVGASVYTLFAPLSWQPDNNFYGTNGNDIIGAGYGTGTHVVGETDDAIIALAGNDSVNAAGGNDDIEGGAGNDTLIGGAGNDRLDGGTGSDALSGGTGDDTYLVDSAPDTTTELDGEGTDKVIASVNWTLAANIENLDLSGVALTGTGNAGVNIITGTAGNNTLDGAGGADSMIGGLGNDTYHVDDLGDIADEATAAGSDTVIATLDWTLGANLENLQLTGAARIGTGNTLNNSLTGTAGDDTLDGLAGNDTMNGGAGNDTYHVDSTSDVVTEALGGGTDTVIASANFTLAANVENLQLTAAARIGTGNTQDNAITGTDGDDTLDGAAGNDTLSGGLGNDTYKVDAAADVIIEAADGGIDTVITTFDYVLADELESLTLTGAAHSGTGNAGANTITGGAGNDTLDGGAGADLLIGGLGDDTYLIDQPGDVVQEAVGGGTDTVIASFDITLADNIEILQVTGEGTTATGNDGDNLLKGDAGSQTLIGGLGNDSLDGGIGGDSMVGGDGNDTYVVDDLNDIVVETADGGIDTVVTAFEGTIAENIENIRLTDGAHRATGNSGNNTLSGNSGDDILDGADGDDVLLGGDGNDELHSHSGKDTLSGGSGDDVYKIKGGSSHIEDFLGHDTIDASDSELGCNIDLSGETDSDVDGHVITIGVGGTTASPLDVQFLQDLSGSFGDDIATVRGLVPQIVTALRAVQTNSEFGVSSFIDKGINPFGAPGEWVYRTTLALTPDQTLLATTYNGLVIGSGADGPEAQIEGLMQLALHSTEVGFRPDSARFVVLFTDAPFHQAGDGVAAGITTPNNGDAIMDGGGIGEDYPLIAQVQAALAAANIIPIFAIAGGQDPVYASLVTQLGRGAVVTLSPDSSNVVAAIIAGLTAATTTHIEDAYGGSGDDNLKGDVNDNTLLGNSGHDDLSGNSGRDRLEGGDGDDRHDGGAGIDTMLGGLGNDTYVVDSLSDVVIEAASAGVDTIESSISKSLAGLVNIENLTLIGVDNINATGNALNNVLTGNDGNNVLIGGLGADTLQGGLGNDTYYVENVGDLVIEAIDAGIDTVRSTISYTLTDNVEKLVLTGLDNLDGFGNDLDNVLVGNIGNNNLSGGLGNDSLNGGIGADTMVGGLGDDTYTIDNVGDVVVEEADAGVDRIFVSFDYTLAGNFESLFLSGVDNLNGVGNDHDNRLVGNAGNNSLTGGLGNDTLNGGLGIDTMQGGLGDDAYVVDNLADVIIENAGEGIDKVNALISYTLGETFETLVLIGTDNIDGVGNDLNNVLFGNIGNNNLSGGLGNDYLKGNLGLDTMTGGLGNDTYLVDDAGDVVIENVGEGTDRVNSAISYTLLDNFENLVLTGIGNLDSTENLNATGNSGNNSLIGNSGNNSLDGGLGNDVLSGGTGLDILIGGFGNDRLTGGADADQFVFNTTPGVGNVDTITDFLSGADSIVLDGAVFTGFGGALTVDMFVSGAGLTTAADADDHLIYNASTGGLFYDADGFGGAAAVKFAHLSGAPAVSFADFSLL
jgi:Ca2+-binding RTX toxin-like protein